MASGRRGRPPSVFARVSPVQGRRLQQMLRRSSTDYVSLKRAQIVLASAQGASVPEIARTLRSSPDHVREVIHAFNEGGFEALKPRWHLEGRPRVFSEETRARIVEIATARPRDLGAPFTEWSLAKLQLFLMEEGVVEEISHETIRRILAEEGISYQRLKTWKGSPDPDYERKKNRVLRVRRLAKKGVPVVALDEFGPLSLRPWPGQGWFPRRRPRRRRATFRRDKAVRYLMGGLDLTRDELYGQVVEHKDHVAFIDLLRATRARWPESERIYAICDNLSSHLTEEVEHFCLANNITIVLVPTYASWLNPIEPHFLPLRRFVIDGSDYGDHHELAEAIASYLCWRNAHRDLKLWLARWKNTLKAA
jgi:transposase